MPSNIHHNLVRGKIRCDFTSALQEKGLARSKLLTMRRAKLPQAASDSQVNNQKSLDWQRDHFEAGELLSFQDAQFIEIVYWAILKRAPDPAGTDHYSTFLHKGGNPRLVIESLRYSPEGEKIGVRVAGIRSAILFKCISVPQMRLHMLRQKLNNA